MAYFDDLSDYTYWDLRFYRPGTRNVGWLDSAHEFPKAAPTEKVLVSFGIPVASAPENGYAAAGTSGATW